MPVTTVTFGVFTKNLQQVPSGTKVFGAVKWQDDIVASEVW